MRRLTTALFAVLLGCGGGPALGLRANDPPPPKAEAGVTRVDEVLRGKNDVALYARSFRPAEREPKAVVVVHHGLKDHGERYAAFASGLAARGYATYAMDMRGHGRSAGIRASVDRFDDYLDDLAMYVEHVRAKEPGKPIFVFGHSAGGAIVTLWAIERAPAIAGVILSAAALENDAAAMQIAAVGVTDTLAPGAPVFDLPNARFSRDPAVVADMSKDPLIHQDAAPAHLAHEVVEGIRRIWQQPRALKAPLLVMHGTADTITAPSGSRDLVREAGSPDKTLRLYEGYAHVLLAEPGHERVESDVVGWLEAHTAADASAARPPPTDLDAPVARELLGDRAAHASSLEIDLRGERASLPLGGTFGMDGGLRFRDGFGKIGYLAGIDLRIGGLSGFRWLADAHVAGLVVRSGTFQLGLSGGIGGRGFGGTNLVRTPVELSIEGGVGPLRLLSRAGLAWKLNEGGPGTGALSIADEATAFLGARLGADRRYWADVHAGGGPLLGVTYARFGGVDVFGVALGLELWGAN
ncbi:MAG: lysophospholipase [Deltaproteobacteria bacterium]|nr:lysophospholipase [Deltaproteobacteria bacterium]